MQPRFEILPEIKLIGKSTVTSFTKNNTLALWQNFMPARKQIKNSIGTALYSVEIYNSAFFEDFNPENEFEKWAGIEVSGFDLVPDGMQVLTIPTGFYAIFLHKGPADEGEKTYRKIFTQWLPESGYLLDNRPHFALMDEKYKHNDPDSEEEIYIPVQSKNRNQII